MEQQHRVAGALLDDMHRQHAAECSILHAGETFGNRSKIDLEAALAEVVLHTLVAGKVAGTLVNDSTLDWALGRLGTDQERLMRALQPFDDGPNLAHSTYFGGRASEQGASIDVEVIHDLKTGAYTARGPLLLGQAGQVLAALDLDALPHASRAGYWLVAAGIALRRIEAAPARAALDNAERAARDTGIAALAAEVARARQAFEAPAARISSEGGRLLGLAEVEALIASPRLVVDACRNVVRVGGSLVALGSRPVLFSLMRVLAEAWPGDVSRETLLTRAFGARDADESHRARLRVEIGRLRKELEPLAEISATESGFILAARGGRSVAVLVPPAESAHAALLALLADGEAWSSSALALALGTSPRTVQRALEQCAANGSAESFGRGRACRWMARLVPGFPTSLLLPAPLPDS